MAVTDVRKHRASVNCLGWKPDKLIDRLVATKRQISGIFFHWQHFSFYYLKALIMSSFKWHSVTSWHFCYSPPHDPPVYCSERVNSPICMRPKLRIAPPCPLYGDSVGTTTTFTFHIKVLKNSPSNIKWQKHPASSEFWSGSFEYYFHLYEINILY